jgi:hypothetical protein
MVFWVLIALQMGHQRSGETSCLHLQDCGVEGVDAVRLYTQVARKFGSMEWERRENPVQVNESKNCEKYGNSATVFCIYYVIYKPEGRVFNS